MPRIVYELFDCVMHLRYLNRGDTTHYCELEASSTPSIAGSLLAWIERNELLVAVSGCKIKEQSLSMPSTIHNISFDTTMKVLRYPAPPLFTTVSSELVGAWMNCPLVEQ